MKIEGGLNCTCRVTITGETRLSPIRILDGRDVVVWLTDLTMRPVSVSPALHALSPSPGLHVQLFIEPALGRPAAALTR